MIDQRFGTAKAQFDKVSMLLQRGSAGLRSFNQLAGMGQAVSRDDVFKHAMQLIQGGHADSKAVAASLASMPPDGPALAEWVQGHQQDLEQKMGQLGQVYEAHRQELGQASLHKMLTTLSGGGQDAS